MTAYLYRRNKDNKLYLLYKVSPMKWTGSWFEAVEYFTNQPAKFKVRDVEKEFTPVAELLGIKE